MIERDQQWFFPHKFAEAPRVRWSDFQWTRTRQTADKIEL